MNLVEATACAVPDGVVTNPSSSRQQISARLNSLARFILRPWLLIRTYHPEYLRPDIIAGLTVAVITLPQAMAYALIAELPPQVGLYAAIVGSIAGALWGSSSHLQTGPTNAASLLVLSVLLPIVRPDRPEYIAVAGLMAVLVGMIRLTMALAGLGVMVNFVSDSVVTGFTAGAGLLIGLNQLRNLFRLPISSAPELFETAPSVVMNLQHTHLPSLLIGIGTIGVILFAKRISPKLPGPLLGMVIASALVAALHLDNAGVRIVGPLPRSLPPLVRLPLLNLNLMSQLAGGSLAVAAIGLVEATSIARSISSQSGERLDSNQEFFGQGIANIAAGLLSGYTVSGSFTRSAINYEAGARTAVSSIASGLFILLAMVLFAPLATYIPLPALAGVLILTAYNLVDLKEIRRIWQARGSDRSIMVVTGIATLVLPLQYAVFTGILLSVVYYLLRTSTPHVRVVLPSEDFRYFTPRPGMPSCTQLGVIEILGDLYFGAVNHIEDQIRQNLERNPTQRFVLMRMYTVENCDISGIHTLESILHLYRERHGDVYFVHVQQPVRSLMRASGFEDLVGTEHFLSPDEAIDYLFHRILDPAICIYECPHRVFQYCQNLPKRLDLVCTLPHEPAYALDQIPHIEARALWQLMTAPDRDTDLLPHIVDVREPREYTQAHIPGALSIPFADLLQDLGQIPRECPVVLVCQGGRRSTRAAAFLCERGYDNVQVLRGGMLAWEKERLLEAV